MSEKIEPVACCHRIYKDGVYITAGWFVGDINADDDASLRDAGYEVERAYSATTVSALEDDRDSWRDQASDRVKDWDDMRKERDALEARVSAALALADALDLMARSPDVTIPPWHRLSGLADEFRRALKGEAE